MPGVCTKGLVSACAGECEGGQEDGLHLALTRVYVHRRGPEWPAHHQGLQSRAAPDRPQCRAGGQLCCHVPRQPVHEQVPSRSASCCCMLVICRHMQGGSSDKSGLGPVGSDIVNQDTGDYWCLPYGACMSGCLASPPCTSYTERTVWYLPQVAKIGCIIKWAWPDFVPAHGTKRRCKSTALAPCIITRRILAGGSASGWSVRALWLHLQPQF